MFATLAFTGMRIGELQQLRWEDVDLDRNVIHVRRGGSGDRPKDKEDRFISIHAKKLKPMLESLPRKSELTFLMPKDKKVSPKKLRAYLKDLCRQCGFQNLWQYKLHTFRHFFASYYVSNYKTPQKINGEGGIRTRGAGLYPHDGLANRCLKPLGHLSE